MADNQEYSARWIMDRYEAGKKDKENWATLWKKCLTKFEGELLYTKQPWQSDISVPLLFVAVTKMVAKELKQYWGKKFWELSPVRPETRDAVEKRDRLLEIQILGLRGRMKKWFRFTTFKYLYGPGIVKVYWDEGGPNFDVVDPNVLFVEPGADTIEDAVWVCHEALVDKGYVRRMFEEGVFSTKFESDSIEAMLAGAAEEPPSMENANRDKKTKANLIEYWEDGRVIVVLNKKYKVRDEANPYKHGKKPFLFNVCNDSWNAVWGSPLAFNVYNILDKLDRHVNMRLDLARLLVNPPVWKGARAGIFPDPTLTVTPGKIFEVNDIQSVSQMRFDGALDANNVAVEVTKKMAQETMGIDDYALGASAPSMNDTAMGAATMAQAANDRIDLYMLQCDDFAVKFVEMWDSLNQQFLLPADGMGGFGTMPIKMEYPDGPVTQEIGQEDLSIPTDIVVEAPGTMPNKMAQQQNEIQLYTILKGDINVDQKEALKALLQAFDRDVERYTLDDQEKIKNAVDQILLQGNVQQAVQGAVAANAGDMVQAGMMTDPAATTNTEAQ